MNSSIKNILVTGSSGMIGTALVQALQKKGYGVYGFDIKEPAIYSDFKYKVVDLTKPVEESFGVNIDLVIHLAAHARVYELVIDPAKALENATMVHNIFEWCRKNEVKRFLFASSRETYGDQTELPVKESVANQRFSKSNYTAGKIFGEAYCYSYSHCYNMQCKIMRLSNVYGKYDFSDRFIPKIINQFINDQDVTIYGENKTLDFTYLDDCVNGICLLINKYDVSAFLEYNIASGTQSSLIDVAQKIKDLLDSKAEIKVGENLTGEVFNYQADISRMKNIGYAPKISVEDGIEKSLGYYSEYFAPKKSLASLAIEQLKIESEKLGTEFSESLCPALD
ncbi:MAG: NAD(P)-dependent oxidoreductase [Candidatus Moraniibacteriota bacterium]